MLDQPWAPVMTSQQQPHYQPIKYCTWWHVLGSFDNCNTLQLSRKATYCEEIDRINQVILDGISDNMAALVQTGKYGAINTRDKTTMGYYVIKFMPESYTLQEDTKWDVKSVHLVN